MSIVDLWNKIVAFVQNFPEFVEKNYSNPIFWIVIFLILLFVGRATISAFSDK